LYAGSLNTTGRIEMTVTARAVDSTLARIVHLVEEAHASKAPSQRFIDRFSARYTPAVLVLAVAVAIVPPLLGELGAPWPGLSGWEDWLYRALVLLVVSCPCALVISTPVALVSAITRASRNGVLIKGGAFLEAAASVSVVAFDKTGTITCGEPRLTDVVALVDLTAEESLLLAAALERSSAHPVARAVVAAAPVSDASQRVEGLSETPGRGVRAEVDGVPVVLGGLALLADEGLIDDSARGAIDRLEAEGKTALGMAVDGKMSAVFGVADTVRPVVGQVVDRLREDGIGSIVMLTGDNDRAAAAIAARAGIADVRSRLLPADKTRIVRELQDSHGPVLMVGDGINDAPALAASDIGVAMGVAGSDTALETADVALMNDDLTQIPLLLDLGRRTMSIIRQNVAASIGIKAAVLVAAVAGHATLWMAVFADTGVSLLVIANGLRLLGTPGRRGG
jgi:Cd2+/Zn2+-exporting ATPase